jgi:hypothetical protein
MLGMDEHAPEQNSFKFVEPPFMPSSLIWHRLLSGEQPQLAALREEMIDQGITKEAFHETISFMQSTGRVVLNEYDLRLSIYKQAPFN